MCACKFQTRLIGETLNNERVLIVEDEIIIAQDLMARLKRLGYSILGPATTGAAAIELAKLERPDVILMDISLGGDIDGIEAAAQIKSFSNVPVIYVTAFSDDAVLDRAKPTTPSGYLIKPFVERELKATIETACYRHRMEEELRQSREQYRALLDASGAVPWEMDAKTMEFTYVGAQCSTVFGLAPGDMGRFDTWLGRVHEEDRAEVEKLYRNAAQNPDGIEVEYRVDPGDGRQLWIRDTLSSSNNSGGELRLRGYMLDITKHMVAKLEREQHNRELKEALDRIKTLHGLLPICAWCKKIRDDKGYWQQVEVYVKERSEAEFTHSICPDCRKDLEDEEGK